MSVVVDMSSTLQLEIQNFIFKIQKLKEQIANYSRQKSLIKKFSELKI